MQKFWKIFNIFEESIMVAGMAVMVLFNFLNVVCRYLMPQTPFSYTEELVVLVFIWVSMFGISYGYRIGSHTVLTLASDMAPASFQPFFVVVSTIASALLMLFIAYTGYGMVLNQIKHAQILPGMGIPMYIVGWSIPVGAAVTFVSILRSGFTEMRGLKGAGA